MIHGCLVGNIQAIQVLWFWTSRPVTKLSQGEELICFAENNGCVQCFKANPYQVTAAEGWSSHLKQKGNVSCSQAYWKLHLQTSHRPSRNVGIVGSLGEGMYSHMAVRGRDFAAVLKSISFSPTKYICMSKYHKHSSYTVPVRLEE